MTPKTILQIVRWALLALLFVIAYRMGVSHGSAQREAQWRKAVDTAFADAERSKTAIDEKRLAAEIEHVSIEIKLDAIQQDQTREVIEYVQSDSAPDCELDARGLRLWNAANSGELPAAADRAEPAAAMPGAAAGTGPGIDESSGRESRPSRTAVPPLQRAAGSAGESDKR